MENKKELRPMNVRPEFKSFIKKRKSDIEENTGMFVSEYNILMSYIVGNEKFVKDFGEYCENKKLNTEDLLKVLTE
jgi:hypothetical protein